MTSFIIADERSRLLASLDLADDDTAHGLIDLGIGMPALGTVKLSDLAVIAGARQQPVMRDRYFQPVRRLSQYLRLAEDDGSIPIERHRKARRTVSISVWSVTRSV